MGIGAPLRQFHNHACAPRIASKEPVAQSALHFHESGVGSGGAIENALREHRRGEIVGAPNARDAPQERMRLCALISTLNAGAQIANKFGFQSRICGVLNDLIMAHIHERIPLIVACAISTHPRSERFAAPIFHGLIHVLSIAGEAIEMNGSELHIIHPIILLINVRRND